MKAVNARKLTHFFLFIFFTMHIDNIGNKDEHRQNDTKEYEKYKNEHKKRIKRIAKRD